MLPLFSLSIHYVVHPGWCYYSLTSASRHSSPTAFITHSFNPFSLLRHLVISLRHRTLARRGLTSSRGVSNSPLRLSSECDPNLISPIYLTLSTSSSWDQASRRCPWAHSSRWAPSPSASSPSCSRRASSSLSFPASCSTPHCCTRAIVSLAQCSMLLPLRYHLLLVHVPRRRRRPAQEAQVCAGERDAAS